MTGYSRAIKPLVRRPVVVLGLEDDACIAIARLGIGVPLTRPDFENGV
jgi:hypothetical protein